MERLTRSEACKILGVPESAHSAKIRQRFRFLSHAYHPDKFPDEAQKRLAEEEFKRILEAYRTLTSGSEKTPGAPPRNERDNTSESQHTTSQGGGTKVGLGTRFTGSKGWRRLWIVTSVLWGGFWLLFAVATVISSRGIPSEEDLGWFAVALVPPFLLLAAGKLLGWIFRGFFG